jgi:hypothetical protein
MAKTTPSDAPTIERVSIDSLPANAKSVSAETVALGNAFAAAIAGGEAAVESTVHADRKSAQRRAAVIKRAVAAVKGPSTSSRIIATDDGDGYKLAIFATPVEADDDADEAPAD